MEVEYCVEYCISTKRFAFLGCIFCADLTAEVWLHAHARRGRFFHDDRSKSSSRHRKCFATSARARARAQGPISVIFLPLGRFIPHVSPPCNSLVCILIVVFTLVPRSRATLGSSAWPPRSTSMHSVISVAVIPANLQRYSVKLMAWRDVASALQLVGTWS